MQATIETLLFFNEKGRRQSNQDSIFWTALQDQALYSNFVVCDGVGGARDGEIASRVAAEGFGRYLQDRLANDFAIKEALNQVQGEIDEYLRDHPNSRGMGTTMTLLQLHPEGFSIAHIGDSRVYHIRNGYIVFCTEDHSLVAQLKKQGLIEESERAQRNIITRAIQGKTVNPVKEEVYFSNDLQTGDYFLLCTDGVWDCLPDVELLHILTQESADVVKVNTIQQICAEKSNDNYSMILVRIGPLEQDKTAADRKASESEEYWGASTEVMVEKSSGVASFSSLGIAFWVFAGLLLLASVLYYYTNS